MDWGFAIQIILGIVGAALIVGGIVAYLGSRKTGVRAFCAAAVAAGVVMWAVVLVTVPASSSDSTPPSPTVVKVLKGEAPPAIAEESFMNLLTEEDVRGVRTTGTPLTTRFNDYKAMAERVDLAQVENMDSWYGLVIEAGDGAKGITFSAIDFDTTHSAQDHFEKMKSEAPPGMQDMAPPIGDASFEAGVNAQGIGSMLVFVNGDKLVSLHTAQPDAQEPLLSLEDLEELAELVASRL